jgi:hypothetical protein
MSVDQISVTTYALFWVVRINGCIRRGRQPLLRGSAWFFDVHVRSDFYTGAGRTILHRYWQRMLIPFAVDIPIAVAIFASHHLALLNGLVLGLAALIHINHVLSVDLAERQARRFEVTKPNPSITSVTASLMPRRLRDYSNFRIEWLVGLLQAAGLLSLIHDYYGTAVPQNVRLMFGMPAVLLYAQLGLVLIKVIIVRWRSPVAAGAAVEQMEVREKIRRYYLWTCDCYRIAAAAALVFWVIRLNSPSGELQWIINIWMAAAVAISLALTLWIEVKRKHLASAISQIRPAPMPALFTRSKVGRWPICYERLAPMLVFRGANGYSLNLGNRLNHVVAVYLAGLIVLVTLIRFRG